MFYSLSGILKSREKASVVCLTLEQPCRSCRARVRDYWIFFEMRCDREHSINWPQFECHAPGFVVLPVTGAKMLDIE